MDRAVLDSTETRLAEVCGHLNVLHAELVDLATRMLADDLWHGYRSPAQWLAIHAGLSSRRATEIIDIAQRRHELPVTLARFQHGELSIEQVLPIVRNAPAWADTEAADLARFMTVSQLRRVMGSYHFGDQPDGGTDDTDGGPAADSAATPPPIDEFVSLIGCDDGSTRLAGILDADHALELDAALREARDALFTAGHTDVTWVDALMEMARRSLDSVTSRPRRDRYRVYVHLDTRGRATDPHGRRLPAPIHDLLSCDGVVQPVFVDQGIPVSVGRTRYMAPDHTRRLVEHRDRGCRVPGCTQTKWLEVHHITPYPEGPTDTWNLVCLCSHHHRQHHKGDLGIAGNADGLDGRDGLEFTNRHGSRYGPSPPPPVTGPPPAPASKFQHPTGESFHAWSVQFNPPLDHPDHPVNWPTAHQPPSPN